MSSILILVTGLPAVGKTTCALTILQYMLDKGIYVDYETIDRILRIQNPEELSSSDSINSGYHYRDGYFVIDRDRRSDLMAKAAVGLANSVSNASGVPWNMDVVFLVELSTTELDTFTTTLRELTTPELLFQSRHGLHLSAASDVRRMRNSSRLPHLRIPGQAFDYFEDISPEQDIVKKSFASIGIAETVEIDTGAKWQHAREEVLMFAANIL